MSHKTADGMEIVEGLRVWTNNLRKGAIAQRPYSDSLIDMQGWFYVLVDDGTWELQNGERVSTVHPFTGERA